MRTWSVRLVLLSACLSLLFLPSQARAQSTSSAQVNFGAFPATSSTRTVGVLWSQLSPTPPPSTFQTSSNCVAIAIGHLCGPSNISNGTGHATYTLQFTLTPNGQKGSVSSSYTIPYSRVGGGQGFNLLVNYTATAN